METPRKCSLDTSSVMSPGSQVGHAIKFFRAENEMMHGVCCPHLFVYLEFLVPATVKNLTITKVTTSSVSLSWHEPEGNVESYRVRWTDDRFMFINKNTTTIPDLTPGSKYNISVAAVVGNFTTEGQSAFTSTFTSRSIPDLKAVQCSSLLVTLIICTILNSVFKM